MQTDVPPPEFRTADDLLPPRLRRFIPTLAAAGITVAVAGYMTGIREPAPSRRPAEPPPAAAGPAPPAVDYAALPDSHLRPNAAWRQALGQLRSERPGPFDPVTRTDEMKRAALADRAANRAYDGAPPTIPHAVAARDTASCLACHGQGLKVGDRVATKISHALLSNCTQCHVEQVPAGPVRGESPANTFAGIERAGPGDRASPGAPPTIPHPLWMRQDCTSCHGPVARPGLRTTHPWLTNCTQCHAPAAERDRVNFAGGSK